MTPRDADDILNDVLDLDPALRAAFLDRECAGDPELRRNIESLLQVDASFPGALRPPARQAADAQLPAGPASDAITAGTRLGRYTVRGEIGRGGMGIVYETEDDRLRRRVALKVLPQRLASDPGWRGRFEREAQLLAALNHPNIATIHALEESDGLSFLIMELVDGIDLGRRLGQGPLSTDETLHIARQVASALEAAHQQGIVHCDLKPGNIRITPEGRVKLIDFGLARSAADAPRSNLVMGTPGYMSPEQLEGGDIDHRADIWAYGCILFECMCGHGPFDAETPHEVMRATMQRSLSLGGLPSDIPAPMLAVIRGCIERDVTRRLASIRIARAELEQIIAFRAFPSSGPATMTGGKAGALPTRLDPFVGRTREREEVLQWLNQGRLVTLTGVGGAGKTRLAIAVAEGIAQGPDAVRRAPVAWADLAAIADSAQVPGACAAPLGIRLPPGRDADELLEERFRAAPVLLVMDNAEHVLDGCRQLAGRHLATAATLRILVTSREPLGLPGERVYRVPALAESEALDLFLARAGSIPSITDDDTGARDTVLSICRRLDGIPLAIELAARRTNLLPIEEIDRRLHDRFGLLTMGPADALPRHRTLTALFDWSHDLLSSQEQRLLARLAVFRGGFGLDAAEAVAAGDGIARWEVLDLLSNLVDKSLVEVDTDAGRATSRARYRLLETIRQYAAAKHAAAKPGSAGVRARHRDFFLALAEESSPELLGSDQCSWLARLGADQENLRLALTTCIEGDPGDGLPPDHQRGLRLVTALMHYWLLRGHWTEEAQVIEILLERTLDEPPTATRAHALLQSGDLALYRGELDLARLRCEDALARGQELGDVTVIARAIHNLGGSALYSGEYAEARARFQESLELSRRSGLTARIALAFNSLGVVDDREGRLEDAAANYEASLAAYRQLGDRYHEAILLSNLGGIALQKRDHATTEIRLQDSIAIHRELGDRWGLAHGLYHLGSLCMLRRDALRARALYRECLRYYHDLNDRHGTIKAIAGVALSLVGDDAACGLRLLEATEAFRVQLGVPTSEYNAGEVGDARRALRAALDESAFVAGTAEGRSLTLEDAVRQALTAGPEPGAPPTTGVP